MLKHKYTSLFIFTGLVMVIIFAAITACAGQIEIPKGTMAILFIGEDGKVVQVADMKGELLKPCYLPSQKKDPVCKEILITGRGEAIDIFFNRKNPCYITIFIGGNQVEIRVPDKYCQ